MKNDNNSTKSTDYTLGDKHFWAAFLNLARHNVYITVNHINKVLELKNKKDQEIIIDNDQDILAIKTLWGKVDTDINKKDRLRELIMKHFPFLEAATYQQSSTNNTKQKEEEQAKAQSFESLKDCLFLFLEKLREARNYYSHYKHSKSLEEPKLEEKLLENMYNIFDTNVQLVIKDYEHNKDINPEEDFKHLGRAEGEFNYYFTRNKKGNITESGLLFFVSLFLEKKDAIWAQTKIKGFKDNRENKQKMTHEVFCRSRMLLPKLRLESTQTQDWILLDMLNELIRCPKSLYKRLQGEKREKFRVPFDPADEDYDAEQEPFKNTLVRHQDRFPYFALRYFDYNEIFTNLRFQIDLGTYHFSIYKKQIGDKKEDRHLTHKLYGFERIQEFAKENRPDEWKALVKDLDTFEESNEPYISETTPHYHLENQKIGIRNKNKKKKKTIWPSLETKTTVNERSKYNLGKSFKAEAFLSVHELLPMMFYYLLLNKEEPNNGKINASKVEGIIEKKIRDIYKLYGAFANEEINNEEELKEYCEGKDIAIRHLPKQMIAILKNEYKDMAKKAEDKQKKMIKDTKKRLAALDKQVKGEVEDGGRNIKPLKSGRIASWLVNDMMRFQPVQRDRDGYPLNNSKANSTEYQLLQRTLALFGSERERLAPYFRQMNLIGKDNPHPFLKDTKWKEHNNILSFYRSYLEAKKNFLGSLKPEDWKKNQYFLKLKEPKTNRETLVQGWKNGFNLPRGIFTEPIREWFIRHQNESEEYKKVKDFDRIGLVAKVIPLFFKEDYQKEIEDYVQPFYGYPFNVGNIHNSQEGTFLNKKEREELWKGNKTKFKDYKTKEKNKEKTNKDKFKKKTDEEKEEFRSYLDFQSWKKFERELRLVRNQDIVTWLLCMELIDKLKIDELNIEELQKLRLKDIDTDTAKKEKNNILNRIMPMELPVTVYETDDSNNIIKDKPLHTIYIKEAETKLLKQGNFKALVKDRRLNGLFSFVETSSEAELKSKPISKSLVEYELGEYQRARVEIIKDMLRLEETLIGNDEKLPTNKFRQMLDKWLEHKKETDDTDLKNDVKLLTEVRNAFSHNQYPMRDRIAFANIKPFSLSSANTSNEEGLGIAKKLKDKTKETIDRIIEIEEQTATKR
ncbi:type VI-B CRISPR-associated RNA-guided ribonuclease Cas13b [Prevotella falsenii]|uniref:type VI-B CRISPR-associated RNA-guided ribonuclease Cas13b n=1 Tax=Prevotella falsenii TaxID=515414 RepID=UPI000569DAF3|nr:type VI-B CRISPR-associated RNA-guided ribonuclease Cas13b [Prevotella falsenii]